MPAQASVRIPVRWRDLDLLGHINQAVYHEYLEEGRAALMASLGQGNRTVSHDVLLPDGTVAASGSSVFVAWDVEARGSRALTDAERAALEA